jgi:E3 ubiquitin-protein ligase DOA10
MSLTNAILIGTGTFVFVTLAWAIILRMGLAGLIEEFARQRRDQEKGAQQTRDRLDQSQQRLLDSQARTEANLQRSDETRARQELAWTRAEQRAERWDSLLSRIEALVGALEQKNKD